MSSTLFNVAFDCSDPGALARFWSQVVDKPVSYVDDDEAVVELPGGPNLYFQRVPEAKTDKNRVHVCLTPNQTRDLEVNRLAELGATLISDHRNPDGSGWAVMGDPEGNEFCVLRSAAEREAMRIAAPL